jgi:hypothetical protein
MSVRTPLATNGLTSQSLQSSAASHFSQSPDLDWLQLSTQQFFNRFNWDDNPPEVQQLRQNTVAGSTAPLSMTLTVSQFFGAINWQGEAIAQSHHRVQASLDDLSGANSFTLDTFSDLF